MNIVFMGTPDFALETLKAIYNSGHNILAVVSQPDKPVGRGMKFQKTPTKEFAEEKGIKVFQPAKVKGNVEFIEEIKKLKPDIIVVVAYGKILPQELLDIPKYGCVNVHGSLLPKYRGAAPIQWAIINGEEYTGITTMKMDAGMDTGDMLLTAKVKIEDSDNYGTLYEKLKEVGAKLLIETLERIIEGTVKPQKQPEEYTIAPMIYKENCKINFGKTAKEIVNLIRGVNPAPGAWMEYNGVVYKVWNARALEESETADLEKWDGPGVILKADSKNGLYISVADGVISILEIQAPNLKRMDIKDYLRGHEI